MANSDIYTASKAYYDRNAQRYEMASWYSFNRYKKAAVRDEIRRSLLLLGDRSEISVLEIGPGTGFLLGFLLDKTGAAVHYTGIEHSHEMANILSQRYADRCASFTLILKSVTSGLLSTMGDDGRFDLVIGSSILHHLPDYEDVVQLLAAKTRPGGAMYFVREPIHRDECVAPGVLMQFSDWVFGTLDGILMKPAIRNRLWPGKVKAEDTSAIAVQMFRDGVSTAVFRDIATNGFSVVSHRKYNRRVSSLLSFVENKWMAPIRKDIFGNTLYSISLQKKRGSSNVAAA